MANVLTTKTRLRRAVVQSYRQSETKSGDGVKYWRSLNVDELAAALSQKHVVKNILTKLLVSIDSSLNDQAVALVRKDANRRLIVVVEDGLHHALLDVLAKDPSRFPFFETLDLHIVNLLDSPSADEEMCSIYEFIEHYWGWRLVGDGVESVYLIMFGPEVAWPPERAEDAALLSRFVLWHVSSPKRHEQLISDLSSETQGLRISYADALCLKIDQWVREHGVAE